MCCCIRTCMVESSGSELSCSCLEAACNPMLSATKTTPRHDDHTGRWGKGVVYFTAFTTAVLETMMLTKSMSLSLMTHIHVEALSAEKPRGRTPVHAKPAPVFPNEGVSCCRRSQECALLHGYFIMNDVQTCCSTNKLQTCGASLPKRDFGRSQINQSKPITSEKCLRACRHSKAK